MPTYHDPQDAENPLTQLILRAVPENELGNKTLDHARELLGVSRTAMRKWLNNQKVPPNRATALVEMGRIGVSKGAPGRVSIEDLHPFVYS